jgi:hypothetical protein
VCGVFPTPAEEGDSGEVRLPGGYAGLGRKQEGASGWLLTPPTFGGLYRTYRLLRSCWVSVTVAAGGFPISVVRVEAIRAFPEKVISRGRRDRDLHGGMEVSQRPGPFKE